MATFFCCGAECGIVTLGASVTSPHWNSVTGSPTVATTPVRSGARAFRFNMSAASAYLTKTHTGTSYAARFYVRFASSPSANTIIWYGNYSGGQHAIQVTTGRQLQLKANLSSTWQSIGSALSLDTWYRVDIKGAVNGTTATVTARIDGGTDATDSYASAATALTNLVIGITVNATVDMYVDDILYDNDQTKYPLGPGAVEGLYPSADGTHSFGTSGDFLKNTTNATQTDTDLYTYIDQVPMDNTNYIAVTAGVSNTEYVEIQMANSALSGWPVGVQVTMAGQSAATSGTNKFSMRVYDSGGSNYRAAITDQDISASAALHYPSSQLADGPGITGWTKSAIDGAKIRFNSSWGTVDAAPVPRLYGVLFEVAWQDITGSGTGSKPTGYATGSGTGEIGYPGSGTGTKPTGYATGSGTGTHSAGVAPITGSGTGTKPTGYATGAGTGTETFEGSGTGTKPTGYATGAGTGTETFSGSGTGVWDSTRATGSGTGTETFEGSGTGTKPTGYATGAGTGNINVQPAGSGTGVWATPATGSGTGAHLVPAVGSGTGVWTTPATGSGVGVETFTGSGTGVWTTPATGSGTGHIDVPPVGSGTGVWGSFTGLGYGQSGELAPDQYTGGGGMLPRREQDRFAQRYLDTFWTYRGTGKGQYGAVVGAGAGRVSPSHRAAGAAHAVLALGAGRGEVLWAPEKMNATRAEARSIADDADVLEILGFLGEV